METQQSVLSRLKYWFSPLGFGLLVLVMLKFGVLYGVGRLWVKDHKVRVTTQDLQDRVFSLKKGE